MIVLALWIPTSAWAETTLTFCYDPYPPFTIGTEGAPSGGLKVRLLEAVVAEIDRLSANVILLPWKRCQAQAKAGEVDGILPLFANPERETYLAFTDGTFEETSQFWFSHAAFPQGLDWDGGFDSLAHLSLGMLNGSFINQQMEAAFSTRGDILHARDVQSLLELLLENRVDLVATDSIVARHILLQRGWQNQIGAIERPIDRRKSRFGLSRITGADRYLARFNAAIAQLEQQGRINAILRSEIGQTD